MEDDDAIDTRHDPYSDEEPDAHAWAKGKSSGAEPVRRDCPLSEARRSAFRALT